MKRKNTQKAPAFTEETFNRCKMLMGYGVSNREISNITGYATGTLSHLPNYKDWNAYLDYKKVLKTKYSLKSVVVNYVDRQGEPLQPVTNTSAIREIDLIQLVDDYNAGVKGKDLYAKYGDINYRLRVLRAALRGDSRYSLGVNTKRTGGIPEFYHQAAKELKQKGIVEITTRSPGSQPKQRSVSTVTEIPSVVQTTSSTNQSEAIFKALDNLLGAIDAYVSEEVTKRSQVYANKMREAESEMVQKALESNSELKQKAKESNWAGWLSKTFGQVKEA